MAEWTIGLLTWFAIIGGAAAYARFVIKFSEPKPQHKKPTNADYIAALAVQAEAAEKRAKRMVLDGMTLEIWLSMAANHLIKLWPRMTYDQAMKELREHLADAIASWPSDEWDWSAEAAKEAAESYMNEYGEEYGANQ